jgi:hypothetical protein
MGTIQGFCAKSHASAICAGVLSFFWHALQQIDKRQIGGAGSGVKRGDIFSEIGAVKFCGRPDLPS